MYAVEFQATIKDGVIEIPQKYLQNPPSIDGRVAITPPVLSTFLR